MNKTLVVLIVLLVSLWLSPAHAGPEVWGETTTYKMNSRQAWQLDKDAGPNWVIPWKHEVENSRKIPDGVYWAKVPCFGENRICLGGVAGGDVIFDSRKTWESEHYLKLIYKK